MIVRAEPRHGVSEAIKDLAHQCLGQHAGTVSEANGQHVEPKRGGFLRRKARTS